MQTPLSTSTIDAPTPAEPQQSRRRMMPFLVASALLVVLVGASFAATITINSDSAIEFGQGAQDVSACDATGITPTITAAYANGASTFTVGSLLVEGLDAACNEKFIRVGLWDDGGDLTAAPPANTDALDYVVFQVSGAPSGGFILTATAGDVEAAACTPDVAGSPVIVTCNPLAIGTDPTAILAADLGSEQVARFTVETFTTRPSSDPANP